MTSVPRLTKPTHANTTGPPSFHQVYMHGPGQNTQNPLPRSHNMIDAFAPDRDRCQVDTSRGVLTLALNPKPNPTLT